MSTILSKILGTGVMAIVRCENVDSVIDLVDALRSGGIDVIEVSMVTQGALKGIREIAEKRGKDVTIGVGTVLDPQAAQAAILAGAEFVVTPVFNPDVIKIVKQHKKIIIPGALTPTEIFNAWEQGADMVKVFPAEPSGPGYIKAILGPLPQVKLMPVGGVGINNAREFIKNGASALGIGGSLVDRTKVTEKRWDEISEMAAKLIEEVKTARQTLC
jgi:2-dehydro-3-deoxyphosphogluconate aldolase/(4S)-4-hydroxy-2-oxoglutarate aldolase